MSASLKKKSLLVISGLASLALVWSFWGEIIPRDRVGVVFFLALTLVAEALPVRLPQDDGSVSVGFAVVYAAVMVLGPASGAMCAALGTISKKEILGEVALEGVLFNRFQLFLAAGCAGKTFVWLGGQVGNLTSIFALLPMIAGAVVYFLLNTSLVTLYLSFGQEISPWNMWLVNFKWAAPHYLALIPLAFLVALSYNMLGWMGVLFFCLPLLLARYSFQRYIDMQEIFLGTITSLSNALEARDAYTSGHAERVSKLAVATAEQLGWPADKVQTLEYVALLHDIGKIGISDEVLKKTGRYTQREYQEMLAHPMIGSRILEDVELLGEGASWVRHHHEWYNGSGYPDAVSGEEIPEGARIIAVADAFDAMVSKRMYNDVLSLDVAIRELRDCSGTQFDARVVEAFIRALGEIDFSGKAWSDEGWTKAAAAAQDRADAG